MKTKKAITLRCGPCRKKTSGVKEQLTISCGTCDLGWPVEETLNEEDRRVLILNLPCPKCGKADNIMVTSNLEELLPDGNLFFSLVTGVEYPKEILFTATAQEYTLPNAIIELEINDSKDEAFVSLAES